MIIQIELWHVITLLTAILGAFAAMAKFILAQAQRNIDNKFVEIGAHLKAQDDSARRVERDLMELKAVLPRDYVRREDYTQAIASIMIKIDSFSLRVEDMFKEIFSRGAR